MHSLLVPLAALAAAAPAPASYEGVWQGTVGDLPVRACFTNREWGAFGAYYYLSHLKLITLETPEKGSEVFLEGSESGVKGPGWTLDALVGDALSGRWVGQGRALPIRLKRLAKAAEDETPCASRLFHAPRLVGLGIASRRAQKDGLAYTILSLDDRERFDVEVETFQLNGKDVGVGRLNAELRRPLSDDPPEWLECVRGALANGTFGGGFTDTHEPSMISARWLAVVHRYDLFCGGAHPDSGSNYRTFDRVTGREVDLHDWLGARAVKRERPEGETEDVKTLTPAFRNVVLKGWKAENQECDEVVRGEEYWTIGLTRTGFVLAPLLAHVVQACGEEFNVPFARLRPFLTPEVARNAEMLQRP
jgi:hypothetical protein